MTDLVLSSRSGGVRRIVLNRPDKRNAVSTDMRHLLLDAFLAAREDTETTVIVLSGNGPSFCSGFDRAEMNLAGHVDPAADMGRNSVRVAEMLSVWDLPKPVIAQVQGYCLGWANDLVATADIVICGESARFGMPEVREFALPPLLGMWAAKAGIALTKEVLFSGRLISGEEAVRFGLANAVVGDSVLEATVDELAQQIATAPAGLLAVIKQAVNSWAEEAGLRRAALRGAEYHALYHASRAAIAATSDD